MMNCPATGCISLKRCGKRLEHTGIYLKFLDRYNQNENQQFQNLDHQIELTIMNRFLKQYIKLENDRVLLVPFAEHHLKDLNNIIYDDKIWEFMGMYIRSGEDLNAYISDTLSQQFISSYPFVIIDKESNKIAGSTRYGNINFGSEKLEIGWTWYGIEFQGTGLNKACKHELLKYAFENIGVRRVQFSTDLENMRSQKAIEKLGATKEGLFRNNYIDSAGQSRHDVYYSIIREDWSVLKQSIFTEFQKE